jgi:predicted ATPase
MYINEIRITNVRSLRNLAWKVPQKKEAGWHVVIGDNGAGKSTFLRATALALVGPSEAKALWENWDDWLTRGESRGGVTLELNHNAKIDKSAGRGKDVTRYFLPAQVEFIRQNGEVSIEKGQREGKFDPDSHIWSGRPGWFSASYGPFRRFAGGDTKYEKIHYSNPRLAAHLSVFGEDVALTECLGWLRDLNYKKLEKQPEGGLLNHIERFINQKGFLPYQAQLRKVSSEGVEFVDGNNCPLPVEELSDGYRSILSMTFELVRQLVRTYGPSKVFDPADSKKIIAPGVVLIDEVDAHLHPTWQRKVGLWFREHFPNLQFIVTTHSPLVCQAAVTIWRLPRPGSDEPGGLVEGVDLDRLLYGNVLDAYGTEAFGMSITRSDESKGRLKRLAELNRKELRGELTVADKKEQERLRAALPTSAHTISS